MKKMQKNWTKQEEDFLHKWYPINGLQYCIDKLNRSFNSVNGKRIQLKIPANPHPGNPNCKIKINEWLNPTPETSYLMGLMWADGCISTTKNKYNKDIKSTELVLKKSDGKTIKNLMKDFTFVYRPKQDGENQYRWISGSVKLYDLLYSLDYNTKSGSSACKVLNHIPDSLHSYWWLGYLNGDGSIYYDNTWNISFSSCKEQDWNFVDKLCNKLNIKYSYRINKSQIGFGSNLRIRAKKSVYNLSKYLSSAWSKNYGFKRKYDRLIACQQDTLSPK